MQPVKANEQPKKGWTTPELTIHGTVEKITQGIPPKEFGSSDGAFFQGQGVRWAS